MLEAIMVDHSRDSLIALLRAMESSMRGEGVRHLALFGSRARGDHRADSDIDLVVEIEQGRRFSYFDLIGLAHRIEDAAGIPANIFLHRSLSPDFRRTVARDAVEVF